MVSKALLVLLVAACCVHSLNAWPWDKKTTTRKPKTTTTAAPPSVMSREKFLARLKTYSDAINVEVARSHKLVLEAEQADKEGQALKKVDKDVSVYSKAFTDALDGYVLDVLNNAADTSSCISRYLDDKAEVEAYVLPKARDYVKQYMQDVRDTVTAADALVGSMDSVMQRGKAEAAKPDGEYGGDVEAILKAAKEVSQTAAWNNDHISTVLDDLVYCVNVALTLSDANTDMNAGLSYGKLCVRRIKRSLNRH